MSASDKFPTFSGIGRVLRHGLNGCGRFVRRWAKPAIFTFVCLVTLIALFVAEENYRTGKAWEKYQAEARARGEKLTLAELAPPPVPDDQNFAMTPLLKPLYSDPKYGDKLGERLALPDYIEMTNQPSFGQWRLGERPDLAKWVMSEANLMVALKKVEADLAEISAASRRPYSYFPNPYDREPPAPYAGPMVVVGLSNLFEVRAMVELNAGQSDQAANDAITIFQLAHAMNDTPSLLSALTRQAVMDRGFQMIWDGLVDNYWNEAQLTALQQELQKTDLFPEFQQSLVSDKAFNLSLIEWIKQQGVVGRLDFFEKYRHSEFLFKVMVLLPDFVLNRAQLDVSRHYDESILPSISVSGQRINLQVVHSATRAQHEEVYKFIGAKMLFRPQLFVDVMFGEGRLIDDGLKLLAETQSGLDEATLACALERFKMERGDYPARLDELVPQFIAKLPTDVVSGDPLRYQRTADGRFKLDTEGWREKYDYGKGELVPSDESWAWQYTPVK